MLFRKPSEPVSSDVAWFNYIEIYIVLGKFNRCRFHEPIHSCFGSRIMCSSWPAYLWARNGGNHDDASIVVTFHAGQTSFGSQKSTFKISLNYVIPLARGHFF